MGADKLATKLGVTIEEAKDLMQKYFFSFPAIKTYLDTSAEFGRINGFSETYPPYRRIRWYKDHKEVLRKYDETGDYKGIARIERQSKNTPIQGSGADMVKLALVNIRKELKKNPIALMRLTVHDEIVLESLEKDAEEVVVMQDSAMIEAAKVILKKVPMKVEGSISKHWSK